jgi:hypothetical protein
VHQRGGQAAPWAADLSRGGPRRRVLPTGAGWSRNGGGEHHDADDRAYARARRHMGYATDLGDGHVRGTHPTNTVLSDAGYSAKRATLSLALRS